MCEHSIFQALWAFSFLKMPHRIIHFVSVLQIHYEENSLRFHVPCNHLHFCTYLIPENRECGDPKKPPSNEEF
jgi:hypothetical protein